MVSVIFLGNRIRMKKIICCAKHNMPIIPWFYNPCWHLDSSLANLSFSFPVIHFCSNMNNWAQVFHHLWFLMFTNDTGIEMSSWPTTAADGCLSKLKWGVINGWYIFKYLMFMLLYKYCHEKGEETVAFYFFHFKITCLGQFDLPNETFALENWYPWR